MSLSTSFTVAPSTKQPASAGTSARQSPSSCFDSLTFRLMASMSLALRIDSTTPLALARRAVVGAAPADFDALDGRPARVAGLAGAAEDPHVHLHAAGLAVPGL